MSTTYLRSAIASTRGVLADIRADQFARPTPCASWDVASLVDHLVVEAPKYFLSICEGRAPASGADHIAPENALSEFDDRYAAVVAAFERPGVLDTTLTAEFGQVPAAAFLEMATNDVFVHGWDLAKALGMSTDLDHDIAQHLLGFARFAIQDAFRGPEGALFGPEVEAPADATPADALAAFLGRRP